MPNLDTMLAGISTIIGAVGVVIQHRRTPKLPEPAITPLCTTILGVDMNGHVGDLPGYSRMRPSIRKDG